MFTEKAGLAFAVLLFTAWGKTLQMQAEISASHWLCNMGPSSELFTCKSIASASAPGMHGAPPGFDHSPNLPYFYIN